MRQFSLILLLFTTFSAAAAHANAPIEAVEGKTYALRKVNGPWMIMVADFGDIKGERRMARGKGMTAQEAADALVFDLREKGIPAYTYSTDDILGNIRTTNPRTGETRNQQYRAQEARIVVMAGNYESTSDKTAQQTLRYVKKYHPKFINQKNGAVFKATPGRPGPLSKAMLVLNPLLTLEEIRQARRDPLILKLNGSMNHSLLENPGKYSLVIATFHGKSATKVSDSKFREFASKFDSSIDDSLYMVGYEAYRLCEAMRMASKLGYDQDYETWIYHDHYKSVVTIGSFDSPNDPRIRKLAQFFSAKRKTENNLLVAELFTIPRVPKKGKTFEFQWMFDPQPQLIKRDGVRWTLVRNGAT